MMPHPFRTLFLVIALGLTAGEVSAEPPAARLPKGIKHLASQQKPPSAQWLLDAENDTERFRRIQTALGGSDMQMVQIGHRFLEMHGAIRKGNVEMGLYHLGKIRDYMNVMGMKRPRRTPNLEGMFLESGTWEAMEAAFKSSDPEKMRRQFQVMRETCMACHVAEKVGFLNDSSVFSQTAGFPAP